MVLLFHQHFIRFKRFRVWKNSFSTLDFNFNGLFFFRILNFNFRFDIYILINNSQTLNSFFSTIILFKLFTIMPDKLSFFVLLTNSLKEYLNRLISSKIYDILVLASSTFAYLRFVLIGLKLANSKMREGRSNSSNTYLLDFYIGHFQFRAPAHRDSS